MGQWSSVPDSGFSGSGVGWSGPSPNNGRASGDFRSQITAWSGAVLAQDGVFREGRFVAGPHLVPWGGGHNNYGGNEVYAFGPLDSDRPSWARLTDPTIPPADDTGRTAAGRPVSRHTYDTLQYLRAERKMVVIGAPGMFHLGNGGNYGQLFDFTVDPRSTNPWIAIDAAAPRINDISGYISFMTAVDEATGIVWGTTPGNTTKLLRFDPSTRTSATYPVDNPDAESYCKAAIDPVHKIMVFGGNANTLVGIDLANPAGGVRPYRIATTGAAPPSYLLALEWDNVGERFVAWNDSGRTLYFLTPSAQPGVGGTPWTWTSVTPGAGATPGTIYHSAGPGNGRTTLGRMRIVDGGHWRGVVLMPNESTPVVVFRLA